MLRIEDTDRERNNPAAVAAILDGLKWLELDWEGEPVSQFSRVARHREVAEALLASGNAYHCYLSAAELDAMRKEAEAEKRPLTIRSPWRDRDPSEAPAGVPPVIRLKAPREGETVVEDRVQGRVVFQNKDLDDLIILRSDGNPTYNLAVVVDDHDMGITHVVRGVDHLTNAARQTQIYLGMGWDVPVWAHVPLIHGADGAKLSKRHGAQGIEEYRAMGYLAGGAEELPGPPRLEPRRRRDHLARGPDPLVRHRRHQQERLTLRLQEARRPERPLHPPDRGCASCWSA